MVKSIVSVGRYIEGCVAYDYNSKGSLRDFEIVIFWLTSEWESSCGFHWRNEIRDVLSNGKNIYFIVDSVDRYFGDILRGGNDLHFRESHGTIVNYIDSQFKPMGNLKFGYEGLLENTNDSDLYFSEGFITSCTNDYYYNALKNFRNTITQNEGIKFCYFGTPIDCLSGINNKEDIEDLRRLIGETQRRAMSAVMTEQLDDFRSKTFDAALIMPEKIYESVFDNLGAWIAPNPFRGCEGINNAICGFDFDYFMDNNKYTFTYGLNFMNEDVVEYLRNRMQKYY